MRNLSRSRVSNKYDVLWRKVVFSFFLLTVTLLATPLFAEQGEAGKPSKEEVIQKIQRLQAPFIANNGQVDERVRFYAKTFGGTVFVTKDGEIVYSLPEGASGRGSEGERGDFGKQDAGYRMQEDGIIASFQNVPQLQRLASYVRRLEVAWTSSACPCGINVYGRCMFTAFTPGMPIAH